MEKTELRIVVEPSNGSACLEEIEKAVIQAVGSSGGSVVSVESYATKTQEFLDALMPDLMKRGFIDGKEQTPYQMKDNIDTLICKLRSLPFTEDENPANEDELILRYLEEISEWTGREAYEREQRIGQE